MVPSKIRLPLMCLALVLVVLAAYANHFQKTVFTSTTSTPLPKIRSSATLRNAPRFFTDPTMFSTLADHAAWRPITSLSPGDRLPPGRWVTPFYFQLSTFVWFLVQLVLMLLLFRRIMDQSDSQASNIWTAFAAVAFYGLHPANAETINYVIQRGDVFRHAGTRSQLAVVHRRAATTEIRALPDPRRRIVFREGSRPHLPAHSARLHSIYSRQTTPAPAHPAGAKPPARFYLRCWSPPHPRS